MPMELLQALADAEMPVEITNPAVQEELKILHDAGHILCSFPPTGTERYHPAHVHMVTPLGHKALRYFGPGSDHGRRTAALRQGESGESSP